mgnify:CR=1 FL=1
MNITVRELRQMCEHLFHYLESSEQASVDLSVDYYWDIPKQFRYNPYQQPEELNLGQISDDWIELNNILNGEREPTRYALVWLASILRAVGEEDYR